MTLTLKELQNRIKSTIKGGVGTRREDFNWELFLTAHVVSQKDTIEYILWSINLMVPIGYYPTVNDFKKDEDGFFTDTSVTDTKVYCVELTNNERLSLEEINNMSIQDMIKEFKNDR